VAGHWQWQVRDALLGLHHEMKGLRLFAETKKAFGKLDILVNNAAIYRPCSVAELSDFDIERQVRTNYLGPIYTCRAAIPLLRPGSAEPTLR